jgi:hypothetical protein
MASIFGFTDLLQKKYLVGLMGLVVKVVLGRLEATEKPASLRFLALIPSS